MKMLLAVPVLLAGVWAQAQTRTFTGRDATPYRVAALQALKQTSLADSLVCAESTPIPSIRRAEKVVVSKEERSLSFHSEILMKKLRLPISSGIFIETRLIMDETFTHVVQATMSIAEVRNVNQGTLLEPVLTEEIVRKSCQ